MEFELKYFDITKCRSGYPIFILGGPRCGKTTLIKKIINTKISIIYTNLVYEYKTNSSYIIQDDFKTFPEIVDMFKQNAEEAYNRTIKLSWTQVVIDDVIEDPDEIIHEHDQKDIHYQKDISYLIKQFKKFENPLFRWENTLLAKEVFYIGRHWGMGLIISSRFMLIQRPDMRRMLGYVFIFADGIRGKLYRLNKIYQYYLNKIISREIFEGCIAHLEDHQALVIDHIEGEIYWC